MSNTQNMYFEPHENAKIRAVTIIQILETLSLWEQ